MAESAQDANECRMTWKGKHSDALLDTSTQELDIEGAVRAGKTTVCLWRELNALLDNPGMFTLLARWTDTGLYGLVLPLWRAICLDAGVRLNWHADEEYDELPNKARAYVRGLKAQDQTLRYSKFRGLTLARVYIDQAEEIPHDVYQELAARLSQPGFSHQITISPQSVPDDHWIAKEFPEDNRHLPFRRLIQLSVYDNAHNLSPEVIPRLERLYPPEHPHHRTLLLGKRGLNVTGEPVYKGAFDRRIHEGAAEFNPALEIQMGLDFGKHHPCCVFRQVSVLGQIRYLGGLLGQDLYLEDFLTIVLEHRARWFPGAVAYRECCDPAGTLDTSQGTEGAAKILRLKGLNPVSRPDANSPATRLAAIERIAGQMRLRAADKSEKFLISGSDRWLRVSSSGVLIDRFLTDGCEAGYVWSPHYISVANKQVRVPKKDSWYEHGQNCMEYLELSFGVTPRRIERQTLPDLKVLKGPMSWAGLILLIINTLWTFC